MKLMKTIGVALLVGASAAAAAGTDSDKPTTLGVSKATAWIGMDVKDRLGNDVGEIKDLVVDWQNGRINYAVVAVEKWLNIDSKLVAIEPSRLLASVDGKHVIVQMSEAEVNATPGFDDDSLPTSTDETTAADAGATPMTAHERAFEVLDQNRDGYLSELEAKDRIDDDYEDADRNSDGRLDRAEFSAIEMKSE